MVVDIVFLIPVTVVPKARLRREYEEIEGNNVSTSYICNRAIQLHAINTEQS